MRVGSDVPGNRFVALQLAHAQALLDILLTPPATPSIVSDACAMMVALLYRDWGVVWQFVGIDDQGLGIGTLSVE